MRILVLSDSHGDVFSLNKALDMQPGADMVIHLGDGERDFKSCRIDKPAIQEKGNCDWGSDLPAFAVTQEAGYTIYCTHGYAEMVKYGLYNLQSAARGYNADIALFGHTHTPVTYYEDGLWLVNPGSIRNGDFAVVDLTPKGIMPILLKLR